MRLFPLIDTPLYRSDAHRNEKALVTSSTDRTVRLCWKGQSRCYKGHSGPVTALADKLLDDGECKILATGGEDCTIRLWSMNTRAKKHPLISTLHGHEKTLSLLSVAWYVLSNHLNGAYSTISRLFFVCASAPFIKLESISMAFVQLQGSYTFQGFLNHDPSARSLSFFFALQA